LYIRQIENGLASPKRKSLSREAHHVSYNSVTTKIERGIAKIGKFPIKRNYIAIPGAWFPCNCKDVGLRKWKRYIENFSLIFRH